MKHSTIKRGSKEWVRMWAALSAHTGGDTVQEHCGEAWQYMGTHDGQHEFRHRHHKWMGRTVWTTPAQVGS
jgi:hypothetical protein